MNKKIRLEDLADICFCNSIAWEKLRDSIILLTGASGLIGSTIANALLYASGEKSLNIKVVCCVRDIEKARKKIFVDGNIDFIQSPVEYFTEVKDNIDYIIHAANPTSSIHFVQHPIETIDTTVLGTRNMLKIAREKNVKGFIFLSSMEVYGHPEKGTEVKESNLGAFDTTVVRNCYPLSKIVCESMTSGYASEYAVPTRTIRLTQTFGPGVEYNDSRIFAEFARCVIEGKDIVLHSDGKTERCYLYIADAVTAILTVLLSGESGYAYTAANSDSYCSILEMANTVAHEISGEISVRMEIDGIDRGYAKTLYMNLNTDMIQNLGWTPKRNLQEMFERMIEDMKCQ